MADAWCKSELCCVAYEFTVSSSIGSLEIPCTWLNVLLPFLIQFFHCLPQEAKIAAISRVRWGEKSWMKFRQNHIFPFPKPLKIWPLEKAFHKEDPSVKRLLCGQIWLQLSLKVYKESGSFYSNCPKLCFNFHTHIWNCVIFSFCHHCSNKAAG